MQSHHVLPSCRFSRSDINQFAAAVKPDIKLGLDILRQTAREFSVTTEALPPSLSLLRDQYRYYQGANSEYRKKHPNIFLNKYLIAAVPQIFDCLQGNNRQSLERAIKIHDQLVTMTYPLLSAHAENKLGNNFGLKSDYLSKLGEGLVYSAWYYSEKSKNHSYTQYVFLSTITFSKDETRRIGATVRLSRRSLDSDRKAFLLSLDDLPQVLRSEEELPLEGIAQKEFPNAMLKLVTHFFESTSQTTDLAKRNIKIYLRLLRGEEPQAIAKEFGITESSVSLIKKALTNYFSKKFHQRVWRDYKAVSATPA